MSKATVSMIMGSKSDWPIMEQAGFILDTLKIPYEARALSAHRTPDALFEYLKDAEKKGIEVIIAAAGGAAHLPGVVAAKTLLPVIGVPMPSQALNGMDSLLSIVQMPAGIPVATMAIGKAGAINAALFAASILSVKYPEYRDTIKLYREQQAQTVLENATLKG
ncbi:MAG TPA: 5-(carboxyamino)imidazole ribonucleotide mutase [Candidatus Babeliaceae bacterium]|nr:5-(carboxyamino)imidazole ribonucleotide mutase [Candidatus Babeliaceae bacterium]